MITNTRLSPQLIVVAAAMFLGLSESSAQQITEVTAPNTNKGELTMSQSHILTLNDVSFDKTQGSIDAYTGNHQHIIIPDNFAGIAVTEISDYAFSEVEDIDEDTTPENQLVSVVLPNTITHIGEGAFQRNALKQIAIPSAVKRIGYDAFAENALTQVDISDSVTEIVEGAFRDNTIEQLTLGKSVSIIDDYAFANNAIKELNLPDSLTEIGREAFANNAITQVLMSKNITYIGRDAFIGNPRIGRPIRAFGEKKPPKEMTDEEFLEAFGDL
ncbi:leucine-rich repeat domain-containing protein [Vibrio sp. LaRot3]|uniref:leucine-rich repeat domain-containing protein n=1 Tax=Vibrio sp. LaRot3 TaxID=2998829 RepID=UPI0022CE2C2C|nr:leucine-rich repeat domain-containing protein [Vibrio sp. LaRot3]MDA0149629.1 leucine-rich repeat domain-containing protein [Vibrio sp. LaRot3]